MVRMLGILGLFLLSPLYHAAQPILQLRGFEDTAALCFAHIHNKSRGITKVSDIDGKITVDSSFAIKGDSFEINYMGYYPRCFKFQGNDTLIYLQETCCVPNIINIQFRKKNGFFKSKKSKQNVSLPIASGGKIAFIPALPHEPVSVVILRPKWNLKADSIKLRVSIIEQNNFQSEETDTGYTLTLTPRELNKDGILLDHPHSYRCPTLIIEFLEIYGDKENSLLGAMHSNSGESYIFGEHQNEKKKLHTGWYFIPNWHPIYTLNYRY